MTSLKRVMTPQKEIFQIFFKNGSVISDEEFIYENSKP